MYRSTVLYKIIFLLFLDMDGLTAQIIIDTNDGARGVINWQNTR